MARRITTTATNSSAPLRRSSSHSEFTKPELRNENYGFTVGGPIIKDKTFFFIGFEKQQYIIGSVRLATEPSTGVVRISALALLLTRLRRSREPHLEASCMCQSLAQHDQRSARYRSTTFSATVASTGYSYNGVIKLDYNFNEKHHLRPLVRRARQPDRAARRQPGAGHRQFQPVATTSKRRPFTCRTIPLVLNSVF